MLYKVVQIIKIISSVFDFNDGRNGEIISTCSKNLQKDGYFSISAGSKTFI